MDWVGAAVASPVSSGALEAGWEGVAYVDQMGVQVALGMTPQTAQLQHGGVPS